MKLPQINPDQITSLEDAKNAIEILMHFCISQQKEIERLQAENARLKGQPKRPHFKTSAQKQSEAVTALLKEKRVWKKGSKGEIPIDRHENLPEVDACSCGSREFHTLRTRIKIMQGMLVVRNNTAYHGKDKQCTHCGKTYKSHIPADLKGVSFDPSLRSFLSMMKYCCRMTQPLIERFLAGFGITISTGELDTILLTNGRKLHPAHTHLKTIGFLKSVYLQSDATGAKRKEKNGKVRNQYMQLIGNPLLSVFSITKTYTIKMMNRLLGKSGRDKLFVSDDGAANGESLVSGKKQLCWVHEIRHYKKLFPVFTSHKSLQDQILTQWKTFYHLAKAYGKDPQMRKKQQIADLFDEITSQTTGYTLLDTQLKTTRRKKSRLLLFLDYPFLPIHNNRMEQDLREFVVQRNISHETKSIAGDKSLTYHLSVIQTAQKQGLDVFGTLHGLLTGQLAPSVLTATIS